MITKPQRWLRLAAATVVSSVAVIILIGPVWGIDFTGGSLLEVTSDSADPTRVRALLNDQFNLTASVQATADNTLLIRTPPLETQVHSDIVVALKADGLIEKELRFESIGPTIGRELKRKAWMAVSLAVLAMIVYLAYIFRQTAGLIAPWKFGVAAVAALTHDLLLVTVLFVVLGQTHGVVIDTLFVTAMLAILGYSVNDTIVLFNRLKEEWLSTRTDPLVDVMDRAAQKTVIRSLNTSLTTLLVLGTLLLLGGTTIRWFVLALAAGTIVGTYSSLFVALPVLHFLAKKQ
ncbi:protein translocase subunit SecF [Patescibacteria group bacterium]|nr:protein translocase subunit SecF [Patescibacteria group bacterium]